MQLVVDMDFSAILGQDFLLQYCHHIKKQEFFRQKTYVQCWIANEQTATTVEVKGTISYLHIVVWVPVSLTGNDDITDIGFLEQLNTFSDAKEVLDGLIDTQHEQLQVNIVNL